MCRHAALPGPMQALACKRPAPPPAASRSCWPFTTAGSLQASCWKPAGSLQTYCMQVITAGLCAPAECCACRRCGTPPPHAACAAPAPLHSKALRRVQSAAVEAGSDKDAAASATCSVYSTWQGGGRKHLHYEGGARVKALARPLQTLQPPPTSELLSGIHNNSPPLRLWWCGGHKVWQPQSKDWGASSRGAANARTCRKAAVTLAHASVSVGRCCVPLRSLKL